MLRRLSRAMSGKKDDSKKPAQPPAAGAGRRGARARARRARAGAGARAGARLAVGQGPENRPHLLLAY